MEKREQGRLINMISNKVKRLADENLVHENVTVEQVMVMSMIYKNGGTVTQKEIETAFGVRRSTVTSAMQILEKKGFIVRSAHPGDSRAKIVSLTPLGQEKNKKLRSFMDELDGRLLAGLSENEKETLQALLLKLLENIDNIK